MMRKDDEGGEARESHSQPMKQPERAGGFWGGFTSTGAATIMGHLAATARWVDEYTEAR